MRKPPQITTPLPAWQQIADWLREEILSGRYPAGQPIPSEQILAGEFGVTRPTVRRGIAGLVSEGLLSVRRPYGTIVHDPHARPAHTEQRTVTRTQGGYTEPDSTTWTDVHEPVYVRLDATAAHASLLGVDPGHPLAVREVLQQHSNGARRAVRLAVPFGVLADLADRADPSATWTSDGRLPDAPTLYRWLTAHGRPLTFTDLVRARMPVGDESQALHIRPGTPLLVVSRVAATGKTGRPVALEETRLPGDSIEISYPVPVTTGTPAGQRTSRAPSARPR